MYALSTAATGDRRSGLLSTIVLLVLVLCVTACRHDESGSTTETATSNAQVTSVAIDQTGLVLTELGDTGQLSATAYGADGTVLNVPIVWSSTTPADIGVDSSGLVTANTTAGSTQIVAEAGGVRSMPLLVVATVLPVGAVALTDAQIVGEPFTADSVSPASVVTSDSDLDTPGSFDNTYQVILTGIEPPAIGTLLISTESIPVAGRVRAVEVDGGRMTVTLGLASVRELFPNLSIEQVVDMANAEVMLPPDIAALYAVERVGDSYTFTPKPADETAVVAAMAKPAAVGTPIGTQALPPFSECSGSLTGVSGALPISLSAPPLFSITATPTLDMLVTPGNGLERFLVKAEPTIKFEGGVTVTAAFEGKIECAVDLFVWRIPVGGALSFVFGGVVPIGVGMEVGGKLTIATAGVGTDVTLSSKAQVGLVCPGGSNCDAAGSWGDVTAKVNPKLDAPSLGDLRLEPTLFAFGRLELQIGNPFLKKLRFEAVKAKAGGKLQGSFAAQASQIIDTSYKSDYKASAELTAEAGLELGEVIKLLGLTSANALQFGVTKDLGTSPTGTVTADRSSFVNGDTVNFKVTLDPGAIEFIPGVGPYNVKDVVLVRSVPGGLVPTEIARVSASQGQTEFTIPFNATDSGTAQEFTAFLVTALVPFDVFSLEVGTPPSGTQRIAFTRINGSGSSDIYTMNADGTDLKQLTTNGVSSQPAWSPDGTKMAFMMNGAVSIMNADGTQVTSLPVTGERPFPVWSPDGSRIAYMIAGGVGGAGIGLIKPDGTNNTVIPLTGFDGVSGRVAWSPDGTQIAFAGTLVFGTQNIFALQVQGGGLTSLTNNASTDFVAFESHSPAWSPDGTRIAMICTESRDEPGQPTVSFARLCVKTLGGGTSVLAESSQVNFQHPAWSRDGSQIAFSRSEPLPSGAEHLHVIDASGANPRQLTSDPMIQDRHPAWSP